MIKTDAEWKAQLTPERYNVLRHKRTEYAGTSPYTHLHDKALYQLKHPEQPATANQLIRPTPIRPKA